MCLEGSSKLLPPPPSVLYYYVTVRNIETIFKQKKLPLFLLSKWGPLKKNPNRSSRTYIYRLRYLLDACGKNLWNSESSPKALKTFQIFAQVSGLTLIFIFDLWAPTFYAVTAFFRNSIDISAIWMHSGKRQPI